MGSAEAKTGIAVMRTGCADKTQPACDAARSLVMMRIPRYFGGSHSLSRRPVRLLGLCVAGCLTALSLLTGCHSSPIAPEIQFASKAPDIPVAIAFGPWSWDREKNKQRSSLIAAVWDDGRVVRVARRWADIQDELGDDYERGSLSAPDLSDVRLAVRGALVSPDPYNSGVVDCAEHFIRVRTTDGWKCADTCLPVSPLSPVARCIIKLLDVPLENSDFERGTQVGEREWFDSDSRWH